MAARKSARTKSSQAEQVQSLSTIQAGQYFVTIHEGEATDIARARTDIVPVVGKPKWNSYSGNFVDLTSIPMASVDHDPNFVGARQVLKDGHVRPATVDELMYLKLFLERELSLVVARLERGDEDAAE